MRVRALLLALVVLGSAAGCGEPPPSSPAERVVARAALDRSTATLGDRITYTLTVDHATGVDVELPEPTAGLEDLVGLTVVEYGREAPRQVGDRMIEETWTRLRADQLGSYILPPRTVRWRLPEPQEAGAGDTFDSIETAALYLEVESVLDQEDGEARDIRDLKPLEPPPSRTALALIAMAVGSLLILGLLLAWWLRRRREPPPQEPGPPAHERALAALDEVGESIHRALEADDARALRRLYFRLSEVVRLYIEERFALNATDLTSEEIIAALPGVKELTAEPALELRRFLLATDPVKFASRRPSDRDVRDTLESARSFIQTTRRSPETQEGSPTGTAPSTSDTPETTP